MLKKICTVVCLTALVVGCAGRTASPVAVTQTNDINKSCELLDIEMSQIENNIQRLIPESKKAGKNVALGITGLVVWPAWLFMDLSSAEKQEINAYRQRYDHLSNLSRQKHCHPVQQVAQK